MKASLPKLIALIGLLVSWKAFGGVPLNTERTASQTSYGRSVIWETASTSTPFGFLTGRFTTYNGGIGEPLYDPIGNGLILISQELSPNPAIAGQYRTDFLLYLDSVINTYGSLFPTLPTSDSDANGVPDIVQFDRGVDVAISGNALRRWPNSLTEPFVGRVTRAANSISGTYSATFTTGQQLSYSGTYRVVSTRGAARYRRLSPTSTISFELQVDGAYRVIRLTGTSTYTVPDRNTVVIAGTTFAGSDGLSYTTRSVTLRRSGTRYSGELEMVDGEPLTSWPDYTKWHFVIADSQDFDSDGVPDLSDDLIFLPSIVAGPTNVTVALNQPLSLNVSATGTAPLRYRWQRNGADVPGATNAVLTRTSAGVSDAGEYYVFVSNAAGSTRGGPAIVTVRTNEPRLEVLAGPILNTNNGITYLLLAGGTWPTSAAAARDLGGVLATVPDLETQDWIVDRFTSYGGVLRDLWIGFSDYRSEGRFVWESDSMSPYRDWQPGQPDNCCSGEHYVGIIGSTRRWNDYAPDTRLFGVVEIAPPIPVHSPLRWPATIRTNRTVHYGSLGPHLPPPSSLWLSNSVLILSNSFDQQTIPVTVAGLPARLAVGPYMNFADLKFRDWSDAAEIDILMLVFGNRALLEPASTPRIFGFLLGTLPDLDIQVGGSLPPEVANSEWNWVLFRVPNTIRSIDGARRVGSLAADATGDTVYGGVNGGTIRLQNVTNLIVSAVAFGQKGAFGDPYQFTRFAPGNPRIVAEAVAGGRVRLSWPAEQTGLVLQTSASLGTSANWVRVLQSPTLSSGTNVLVVQPGTRSFYRLGPL